jgi:hypothetical protein
MLYTKEFYEIMGMFEKTSKEFIRFGSQGLKKEDKEQWKRQCYYCDGNANEAFKIFLNGVSFGKSLVISDKL